MRLRLVLLLSAPLLLTACGGTADSSPVTLTETVVSTVEVTSMVTSAVTETETETKTETETVMAEPPAPEPAPAPVEANLDTVPQGFASIPDPAPAATATHYANCAAARAAGAAPVYAGQPGYGRHLDRDGDGIGCE